MDGKSLLLSALRGNATPRPAWVPFVGVHGGQLVGASARDYLQSSDAIVAGLERARELYRPDGLPVVFDLQVEAEVLGCRLAWAEDSPPAVTSHPLAAGTLDDLPAFDTTAGRFPVIADALDRLVASFDGQVALYGLITGPFTLSLHLLGNDIFLAMYDDPERIEQLGAYCADVAIATADFYLDHGADVIAVVDPMTSQISPQHFEQFVTPPVDRIFDHVRERGALSSMFVCGDATRVLPNLCATHCDNVSVDENISLEQLRELASGNGRSYGGNLKLTSVLLLGDEDDSRLDALRCLDVAGEGSAGFVLAPGCDLPYATPPANLQAVAEMVHDEYQREVARTITKQDGARFDGVELPDYGAEPRVVVDIITLDSLACAPCQYMVEAVQRAVERFEVPVAVVEHKIKTPEGIGMMCALGVSNLPTICIDGEAAFISRIPDQNTLLAALRERAEAKGL